MAQSAATMPNRWIEPIILPDKVRNQVSAKECYEAVRAVVFCLGLLTTLLCTQCISHSILAC